MPVTDVWFLAAATKDVATAYLELGAALLVLALAGRVATRLELSPIAFYLLGGLALGAIDPPQLTAEFVETTASLGVVLLLFLLGSSTRPRSCAPTSARTRRRESSTPS